MLYLTLDRGQLCPQRRLVPRGKGLDMLADIPHVECGRVGEVGPLEVKVPQQVGQNQAHLEVGQVPADAPARPQGKGLAGLALLVGIGRIEPALRDELVGPAKVVRAVRRGPRVDGHDRAAGQRLAGHGIAALRHSAREAGGHRREDAQGLVDAGVHVGKVLQLGKVHLCGGGKPATDFLGQARIRGRRAHQVHGQAGEQRGRRLRARDTVCQSVILAEKKSDGTYMKSAELRIISSWRTLPFSLARRI